MHAENDLLEQNVKEERAAKVINELQDKLTDALNDRKDIEIEFIALKKNFYNLRQDLDREKVKNENLGVELINLVNENKAVQRDITKNVNQSEEFNEGKKFLEQKIQRLEAEIEDQQQALTQARDENRAIRNQARSEGRQLQEVGGAVEAERDNLMNEVQKLRKQL
jgi:coiled-coil domain-containing protein 78